MCEVALSGISYDIFNNILANRSILDPTDITAMMLVCRRFRDWTVAHITDTAALANGYPQRGSLLATFTCYCGRIGWNVLTWCNCHVSCSLCCRQLPAKLAVRVGVYTYCGFPCERICTKCDKRITNQNAAEFSFVRSILYCNEHKVRYKMCIAYEWEVSDSRRIRSLFADELAGKAREPIPWNVIRKYDPRHRILDIWR